MRAYSYFGSTCKENTPLKEVLSPYHHMVVSYVNVCTKEDAHMVLNIAKNASKIAKTIPLHPLLEEEGNLILKTGFSK